MGYGTRSYQKSSTLEFQILQDGFWKTASKNDVVTQGSEKWDFRSRKKKPFPLTNTGGTINRRKENDEEIIFQTSDTTRWKGPAYYAVRGQSYTKYERSDDSVAGLHTLAMNRLNSTDLNLGVVLGEGRETLSLIANTAIRLVQAYKLLRKGNLDGVARVLARPLTRRSKAKVRDLLDERAYSRAWLALQFGWLPLLQDVHTAATRNWSRLEKGAALRGYADRKAFKNPDGSYTPGARAGWSGRVYNANAAYAQQLGLLNPLAVAWELVPFSFVVDWFFGIKQLLMNMTATAGFDQLQSWYITERRTTTLRGGYAQSEDLLITRGVGVPPGNPIPTRWDFGGWHMLTTLSLLASVFRR